MHADRTRFKKDIVAEFMPATRSSSRRVMILLDGMPSVPSKKVFMEHWAKCGYWVFYPRYRGSWESDGQFLQQSPEVDVVDVIDGIQKGFKSLWGNEKFQIDPKQIVLMGSSFGGTAALMASRDERVDKVVAMSPVVDWLDNRTIEPLDGFDLFVREAFGNGYRFAKKDWSKLKTGKFFNPINVVDEIDGKKLLIFHCHDDKIVHWKGVDRFAKRAGAELKLWKKGGHLGASDILRQKRLLNRIEKFLKK